MNIFLNKKALLILIAIILAAQSLPIYADEQPTRYDLTGITLKDNTFFDPSINNHAGKQDNSDNYASSRDYLLASELLDPISTMQVGLAVRIKEPFFVKDGNKTLNGNPNDILVRFDKGYWGIIDAKTYLNKYKIFGPSLSSIYEYTPSMAPIPWLSAAPIDDKFNEAFNMAKEGDTSPIYVIVRSEKDKVYHKYVDKAIDVFIETCDKEAVLKRIVNKEEPFNSITPEQEERAAVQLKSIQQFKGILLNISLQQKDVKNISPQKVDKLRVDMNSVYNATGLVSEEN